MTQDPGWHGSTSWIELDGAALRANLGAFRQRAGGAAVGAVVKGNAYGHGFDACLPTLHAAADVLYVIRPEEALAVRAWEAATGAPRRDVLVIGALVPEEAVALARADVAVVLADPDFGGLAAAVRAAGAPPLRAHVHVDTGLSREGFRPEALLDGLAPLDAAPEGFVVEGLLTHFADVEDVTDQVAARAQLAAFADGAARLDGWLAARGRPRRLVRHTAASAAALVLPESRHDVVRIGISAYGLWPSVETRISARALGGPEVELRPVLAWRCPSQIVKRIPAGASVGYGGTHTCDFDTTIAVLPVGYWDGYPRALSNRAYVLVRGHRCRVLGRVMMNHVVVDVTRVAEPGDRVVATLVGRDGDQAVSADDLAGWAATISYEITTRLGPHLRRVLAG